MSLINKMLQELDARGGAAAGAAAQSEVRLVVREPRRRVLRMAGGALLVALVAAGYAGWRARTQPRALAVAAPVKTVLLAPLPPVAVAPPAEIAPVAPVVPVVPVAPVALEAPPAPPKASPRVAALKAAGPVAAPSPVQLTPSQRAETEYRRALASLQEGRSGEAIAALEQSLQIDARHEAARQTLVGLLVEHQRPDDAMHQLQLALAADPRQPAMAMLLARLQIERGGAGVDVLLRTLPFAAGDAGYHAFLAGALQRQQRHREAAEHYQAALRVDPQHGVWLMGLGMSLLAEKRNGEARVAFTKARLTADLAPQLQAFVDRQLLQLTQ
jgi:MSHA biogenesis protein MshN